MDNLKNMFGIYYSKQQAIWKPISLCGWILIIKQLLT